MNKKEVRPPMNKDELFVDALAQEIRRVDGGNNLGAGALAEALMPFLQARSSDAELVEALEQLIPITQTFVTYVANNTERNVECPPLDFAISALAKHKGKD